MGVVNQFFRARFARGYLSPPFPKILLTPLQLFAPCMKPVTYISEHNDRGAELVSKHFPNSWGFLWRLKKNTLTPKLMAFTERERKDVYCQLAARRFGNLCQQLNEPLTDGLLSLAGEEGKAIISEAYRYLGVPPLVSYNSDLLLMDLNNKVPLGWVQNAAPIAFNVHPAPPDKRGAGVYIPSLVANEKEYAVTVHILNEQVDDRAIIFVKRFPIPKGATRTTLYSLTSEIYRLLGTGGTTVEHEVHKLAI